MGTNAEDEDMSCVAHTYGSELIIADGVVVASKACQQVCNVLDIREFAASAALHVRPAHHAQNTHEMYFDLHAHQYYSSPSASYFVTTAICAKLCFRSSLRSSQWCSKVSMDSGKALIPLDSLHQHSTCCTHPYMFLECRATCSMLYPA